MPSRPRSGFLLADGGRRLVAIVAWLAPLLLVGAISLVAYRSLNPPSASPPGATDTEPAPTEQPPRKQVAKKPVKAKPKAKAKPRKTAAEKRAAARPGRSVRFGELEREVAAIRNLSVRRRINARVTRPEALADKITALASEDLDREDIEADKRLLVTLRLAEPGIKLFEVINALYREQILGVYVPEEKTLYVQQGPQDLSPLGALTAAHEITHALQDQHFDLDRMRTRVEDDSDAALAVLSLIEGDAVRTQQRWAAEHLSSAEQEQAASEGASAGGGEALAQAPAYLRNSLFFPYESGVQFVAAVSESRNIDDVFRDPPTTTEHILHPERYLEGDDPTAVSIRTSPGRGWKSSTRYAFGEFDVVELFASLGGDRAAEVGEGWDGGRVRSWTKGRSTAVSASLAFDSAEDAREACAAIPDWYAAVAEASDAGDRTLRGDRDMLAFRCAERSVQLGIAPDAATARRLAGRRSTS